MFHFVKRYTRWLHTQWPAGVVEKLPQVEPDGSTNVSGLYVVGDLLVIARIAHFIGLKHDNMAHPGRLIGAGGTFLITVVTAGYGLWLAAKTLL